MTSPNKHASSVATPAPAQHSLLRGALGLTLVSILGGGLLYPLAGVLLGQTLFAWQANGSLIEREGSIVGSTLVAQPFAADRYFQPRPSAAGHQPMAAGGSNLARSNPALRERVDASLQDIATREGVAATDIPSDLVTQSGGGFDPHISPASATLQVARVARARGLAPEVVAGLVARSTEAPQLGILGQARVNVLQLNLALDALPADAP